MSDEFIKKLFNDFLKRCADVEIGKRRSHKNIDVFFNYFFEAITRGKYFSTNKMDNI